MCYLSYTTNRLTVELGMKSPPLKSRTISKSTLSLKNGTVTFCGRKGFSPDTGLLPRYWSNVTKKHTHVT